MSWADVLHTLVSELEQLTGHARQDLHDAVDAAGGQGPAPEAPAQAPAPADPSDPSPDSGPDPFSQPSEPDTPNPAFQGTETEPEAPSGG